MSHSSDFSPVIIFIFTKSSFWYFFPPPLRLFKYETGEQKPPAGSGTDKKLPAVQNLRSGGEAQRSTPPDRMSRPWVCTTKYRTGAHHPARTDDRKGEVQKAVEEQLWDFKRDHGRRGEHENGILPTNQLYYGKLLLRYNMRILKIWENYMNKGKERVQPKYKVLLSTSFNTIYNLWYGFTRQYDKGISKIP